MTWLTLEKVILKVQSKPGVSEGRWKNPNLYSKVSSHHWKTSVYIKWKHVGFLYGNIGCSISSTGCGKCPLSTRGTSFQLYPPTFQCWDMGRTRNTRVCSVGQSCPTLRGLYPPGSTGRGIPGKNTGASCHFLLQRIFLMQGSNPCLLHLLHWQADSLPLRHLGSTKLG